MVMSPELRARRAIQTGAGALTAADHIDRALQSARSARLDAETLKELRQAKAALARVVKRTEAFRKAQLGEVTA